MTYYPAPETVQGDLHVDTLTVGDPYEGVVPNNGVVLISTGLWIGGGFDAGAPPPASERLHIVGNNVAGNVINVQGGAGVASNAVFMPGAGGTMAITIGNAGRAAPTAEGTQSAGDKLIMWNDAPGAYKASIGLDANNELWLQSSGNNANNAITFYTSNATTVPSERMRITNAGNVGIGTNAPTASLDVNGQIRMRGGNPGANRVLLSDANGVATWGWPAGSVIQMAWADGGSGSKGAGPKDTNIYPVFAAAGTATISITPRSNNSELLVEATFLGGVGVTPASPPPPIEANSHGYFRLYETTGTPTARGQGNSSVHAVLHSYGAGAQAPSSIRALVPNTVTTQRTFQLYYSYKVYQDRARVNVTADNIVYTVTEIQN